MPDRKKVIRGLEVCLAADLTEDENPCASCPYFFDGVCQNTIKKDALALLKEQEALAAHQRYEFMRSWRAIKFSVMDTANNNAGDGNEDIYRILTRVATMMDQQEAKWNG